MSACSESVLAPLEYGRILHIGENAFYEQLRIQHQKPVDWLRRVQELDRVISEAMEFILACNPADGQDHDGLPVNRLARKFIEKNQDLLHSAPTRPVVAPQSYGSLFSYV